MADTIDQQFVEYIVKSLVGNPDDVKIERRIDEKGVLLELTVAQEDLGRVIGKRGATAQSLRTLLRALGTKQDARYNLKIVDPLGDESRGGQQSYARPVDDNVSSDEPSDSQDQAAPADDNTVAEEQEKETEPEEEKSEETEENNEENAASDRISQTRKELADLDDLDV